MAREMPASRQPDLGRKNILQGPGTDVGHSAANISRHLGDRAVSVAVSARARSVAVSSLDARVVPGRPVVTDPVGARPALASTAPRRADPGRRGRRVAGPGREWRSPCVICDKTSFSLAPPLQARADRRLVPAPTAGQAVRPATLWA